MKYLIMEKFGLQLIIALFLMCAPLFKCEEPQATFEEIVNYCCAEGIKWANGNSTCTTIKNVSDPIPVELMSVCLGTAEICCIRHYRSVECIEGMKSAKKGNTCNRNAKQASSPESDYFKDCCEACKIGLVMSTTVNNCGLKTFTFGSPWDEVSRTCCEEVYDSTSFELDENDEKDLCGRFENLCSQICENTDMSYTCKCHDGFILLEDKITCARVVSNITENLINYKENGSCPKGYLMDLSSNKCMDVDECETGEADCEVNTQICRNELGTFKCVDVIPPSEEDCKHGFRFNIETETCEDINECLEELDNCTKAEQVCLNTRGAFKCQMIPKEDCFTGFTFDNLTKSCQDIDECLNESTCGKDMICVNTKGHYECVEETVFRHSVRKNPLLPNQLKKVSCQMGFRWRGEKCIDIDECASDKSACDSNQLCINDPGGFHCDCREGFQLDPIINACVDVNECQINNHECLEHQRCDNTIGSYTCIRLHSCGTGYTFNAATANCDDDDECALKTHNCQAPYECRNTKGSFRCERVRTTTMPPTTTTTATPTTTTTLRTVPDYQIRNNRPWTAPTHRPYYPPSTPISRYQSVACDPGFERSPKGACTDIDECRNSPCRRNQRCLNTNGSFRCENMLNCPGGYLSNDDGTRCMDVDECATGEASCGPDQICKNREGGYICSCPPGFMLSGDRRCEDMDECKFSGNTVCPSNSRCINTIGSYHCECRDGFRKHMANEKTCYDVDECKEQTGICHQRCVNNFGSYRCSCNAGYKLSSDNRTCHDIDECEIHKSYNLCVGRCENTMGSYACTCPSGYRLGLDGRTCQDIDECAEERPCRGQQEICMNIRGSYRCNRITCPPDYTIDEVKKNRCRRISMVCNHDDIECFQKPSSYSHNYITLTSKMSVPPQGRALFTLKGSAYYESTEFDLQLTSARVPGGVQRANVDYFSVQKANSEGVLYLTRTLEGPQEIELEFTMTVFQNGMPNGRTVAKIYIVVSEHTF